MSPIHKVHLLSLIARVISKRMKWGGYSKMFVGGKGGGVSMRVAEIYVEKILKPKQLH